MDTINYILYLGTRVKDFFELKVVLGIVIAVTGFLFDPTHYMAMLSVFVLICVDFVFGVAASRKIAEPVRSAKVRRTAVKITVYFVLIACARLTEYTLPMSFLDESIIGFLAATELLSILENAGRLGYVVPSQLVKILGDYTKKV